MKKNLWTENEITILKELINATTPFIDISKTLGRTVNAISNKVNKLGINTIGIYKNNIHHKAIYQDYDWCYDKYIIKRMTYEQMAELVGVTKRTIEKWCGDIHRLNLHTMKDYLKINKIQEEIIIGSLCGDGHIDKRETQPIFIVAHAENQKEYLYWKYNLFKELCNKEPSYIEPSIKKINNKECRVQAQYRFTTRIITDLKKYRGLTKGELVERFTPLSFSIFMLDDGHRTKSQWELCVAMFSDNDKEIFLNYCKQYNIAGYIAKDIRYIKFTAESSRLIDKIILNSIPNYLDIIKYKIPHRM